MSTRKAKLKPSIKDSQDEIEASHSLAEIPENPNLSTMVKIARLGLARDHATASFIEPRYGLKNAELKVLIALRVGPMTIIQLSRETRLDKAWVSRSVYGLVQRDMVRKSEMPDDGRAVLLKLTAAGKKLMKEISPILAEREKRLLMGLDKDHVDWLLDTLQARLEKMRAKPPFG